jgi:hypothetical protein
MISETLYANYINEREGFEVLETTKAFVLYKIKKDECFISHAYTHSEARCQNEMSKLIYDLEDISFKRGCSRISASIDLRDKNASRTLLASLKYGFKVILAENGIMIIEKPIGICQSIVNKEKTDGRS